MKNNFPLILLDMADKHKAFPPVERAWDNPNGLLAVGGDLSVKRLRKAYANGIFPWFNEGEPIYWWSPNPRAVLFPQKIRISRSLRKSIRNKGYRITFDTAFPQVVKACAAPRSYSKETWIGKQMYHAYCRLHQTGSAHSIEVWNTDNQLVGGLYGINYRGVFSGESMFSKERDTSKIALVCLCYHLIKWGYTLIDCQIENGYLSSMGAINMQRAEYVKLLRYSMLPKQATWQVETQMIDLSHWKPI